MEKQEWKDVHQPADEESRPRRKYTLEELLQGVTPENLHPLIDFGRPVGNEVW